MFLNLKLSDLENVFWKKFKNRQGIAMLEHLEAQFLKILPLGANHGLFFMGLMYVQVWPKKLGIRHCTNKQRYVVNRIS